MTVAGVGTGYKILKQTESFFLRGELLYHQAESE